ncbi:unnamed protein product [Bursaphelenchus okinawaensis]|uniref:Cytochrome b561 domain-containing protein n=1 Tax=Bursaphelenchus okinawaensis TaxID=465554 RepID=A0A811LQG6_9BILA|nr:unnamed protein product [Bursaphelenchus okinawaensis]CAG9127133.1 unnamed protein product [Bursaphelenchus okinawaensis]
MGVEYVRSVHGLLSIIIMILGSAAMFAGYFVWNDGSVYFLFYLSSVPLVTLILILLVVCWFTTAMIMAAQVIGKDLLEKMGKAKVLIIHTITAILILGAAVCNCYNLSSTEKGYFYYPRMIAVVVCCFLMLVGYIGQIAFVIMQ